MRDILLTEHPVDVEPLIREVPRREHYDDVIDEDARLWLDGRCIGVYVHLDRAATQDLRRLVRTTKTTKGTRTGGIEHRAATFGALPRNPIRNDYCRYSSQSTQQPGLHAVAFDYAEAISAIYREHLPDDYARNLAFVERNVAGDWVPRETPFTTVTVNVNSAIRYHRDTGNVPDVFSNVLILRSGIEGGELVFPRYRVALAQRDGALGIFDGQGHVHGVMPIRQTRRDGYRASVVFYTMQQMRHCYPFAEETHRYQLVRTQKERRRATYTPDMANDGRFHAARGKQQAEVRIEPTPALHLTEGADA